MRDMIKFWDRDGKFVAAIEREDLIGLNQGEPISLDREGRKLPFTRVITKGGYESAGFGFNAGGGERHSIIIIENTADQVLAMIEGTFAPLIPKATESEPSMEEVLAAPQAESEDAQ